MPNLDKLVKDIILALEPNANEELIEEAKEKAKQIFHKDVNDFLDEMEIIIGKKNDLESQSGK